jgi:hypothetical protein
MKLWNLFMPILALAATQGSARADLDCGDRLPREVDYALVSIQIPDDGSRWVLRYFSAVACSTSEARGKVAKECYDAIAEFISIGTDPSQLECKEVPPTDS